MSIIKKVIVTHESKVPTLESLDRFIQEAFNEGFGAKSEVDFLTRYDSKADASLLELTVIRELDQ